MIVSCTGLRRSLVLTNTNGEFLLGEPFVKKLTWASGIDDNGVPPSETVNK